MNDLKILLELSTTLPLNYQPVFSGVINIRTPYNLVPALDGGVVVQPADGVEVEVVSSTLDTTKLFGGVSFLESLIELLIPSAMQSSLQNIAVIPMPSIEGFDLSVIEFWASPDKQHLVMGGKLTIQQP